MSKQYFTLAIVLVAIIILIPLAYGAFHALPTNQSPQAISTSSEPTVSATTTPTSTITVTPTPIASPHIEYITPTSGLVGNTATIEGSGFDVTGNTVLFGGGPIHNLSSSQGGTILTFTIPSSVGADCKPDQACPMYERLITEGTDTVSVRTSEGTSNEVSFVVTGGGVQIPN